MPPRFSRELEEKVITTRGLKIQARTSPCETYCPAGNPIQKVHALIREESIEEALAYLRSRNPFPGITGRVCAHPCENNCNRNHYDEEISIRALERYAADQADLTRVKTPNKAERTGKRLAVIGSGPAGMTCAYFSALFGHEVTVFESSATLGGMPRIGVPDYRLPKHVVDREIGRVLELGIEARTNTSVGKDIAFDEIRRDFDACLIAVGTWKEKRPDIPGAELAKTGVSFLKNVNLGRIKEIGKVVAIVGGGGIAFDCAFTAKRIGASDIHLFSVEDEENMCASQEDVLQARAEGVTVHHSRMVAKIRGDGNKVKGVEFYGISSFEFDESGGLTVQPVSSKRSFLEADTVISAIGVECDFDVLADPGFFEVTPMGTLVVNSETMATSLEGVFGAGDAVLGPSTVAQAIGNGRNAALCIDRYLRGSSLREVAGQISIDADDCIVFDKNIGEMVPHVVAFEEIMNVDSHEKKERQKTDRVETASSFEEPERGFGTQEALNEADRCFHCGHCTSCGYCVEDCPGFVLEMTTKGPQVAHFDECWHCGCCRIACPSGAVYYEFPLNMMV
jgi:NADPH-dependent glutamate synthase beta subunit-like oxidoreductase